jgi:hypothetical protein
MSQEVKVTLKSTGQAYVGIPVSEGPATYRLLLTWPYKAGGRVEAIPLEDIESIDLVDPGPLSDEPKTI